MDEAVYKVLWIDDQPEIVQGYQLLAGIRNIDLIHFENWMDAQSTLMKDFNELTAIILDANCKWDSAQNAPSERFLPDVLSKLQELFGNKHREIPWYILSAGTMTNFDMITDTIISRSRRDHESDWGKTIYLKDLITTLKEKNELFDNIRKVGASQSNNLVLYRHRETFNYMGDGTFISDEARKILLKALAVLYFPEENINYEFAGNPIRKVVEYMFKSAYKYGLLTDDFLDENGFVILWHSMEYLCGMESKKIPFRFGKRGTKKDYSDNESVLPTTSYNTFKGLLNYVNVDSHTIGEENETPYKIDAESKDLFYAYVLFLCHIITCFGKYVELHHDVEENKKKAEKISTVEAKKTVAPAPTALVRPAPDEFLGKTYTALNMGKGYALGKCKVDSEIKITPGNKYKIELLVDNNGSDVVNYPYIVTKVTQQE